MGGHVRSDWSRFGFSAGDEKILRLLEHAAANNDIDRARLHDLYSWYCAAPKTHGPEQLATDLHAHMERQGWPIGDRELVSGWVGNMQAFTAEHGIENIPQPPAPPRLDDARERDRIVEMIRTDPVAYARDEAMQNALYEINERLGDEPIDVEPARAVEGDAERREFIETAMRENDPRYWRADGPLRKEYEAILARTYVDPVVNDLQSDAPPPQWSPRTQYENAMRDGSYFKPENRHWGVQYQHILEQEEASAPSITTGPADTGNGE